MGTITEISSQKNKKRVNIFVDGEFISGLSVETAVKNGLKIGKQVDAENLQRIIRESEALDAFNTGLSIIARSAKSVSEVRKKLEQKEYSSSAIQDAIDKLLEYGYLNDTAYSEAFVKMNASKSKREIKQKLKSKGIDNQIIENAVLFLSDNQELENAEKAARKYMRGKEFTEKSKNNLFASLMRKGFSIDDIYTAIETVRKESNNDWS